MATGLGEGNFEFKFIKPYSKFDLGSPPTHVKRLVSTHTGTYIYTMPMLTHIHKDMLISTNIYAMPIRIYTHVDMLTPMHV